MCSTFVPSLLLEAVNVGSFSTYLFRKLYKESFQYLALKRFAWFSLHHLPTPQYFLHASKKLLPAIVISLHIEENQSMYRLKSSKEKTLSLHVNY